MDSKKQHQNRSFTHKEMRLFEAYSGLRNSVFQQWNQSASQTSNPASILQASPGNHAPIRRIEYGTLEWYELRATHTGFEYRCKYSPVWTPYPFSTMDTFIKDYINSGWKEVTFGGFDPNDLQTPCCSGGLTYTNGKWHADDCIELKNHKQPYVQKITCECGAHKTSNPNCHATWCGDFKR